MLIQLERPRKTTATERFFVWTIGCQMNVAESSAITAALQARGLQPAPTAESADLIVLNSCTIRESAEARVQGQLHRLAHRKKENPHMLVALTGCSVESDLASMERKLPMVDFFFRPGALDHFISQLEAHEVIGLPSVTQPVMSDERPVAAYVSVMQGCNKYCSYCIVPFRRGRERSRPVRDVVDDVIGLTRRGVRDVMLLGQNIDSYGRDLATPSHLADLLEAVSEVPDLWHLRFMTSHPSDMDQKLIAAVARLPVACKHINLPIQAGDDTVLERMRRGYTSNHYLDLLGRIRQTIPGVTIATDIIVGFPGETEEQFQHTLDVVRIAEFDIVHTACYSPRQGTVSATWGDDVPDAEKEERRRRLEAVQEEIQARHNAALLHQTVDVLVESAQSSRSDVLQWRGRTGTNKLVFLPRQDGQSLVGRIVRGRVTRTSPWAIQADLVQVVQ